MVSRVMLAILILMTLPVIAQEPSTDSDHLENDPISLNPRPFMAQRADTIMIDEVIRPNAWWLHLTVGGSIYDARRDVIIGRWSPAVEVGHRWDRWGTFALVELDHTVDLTLETESLWVVNLGAGVEYLSFVGHVRTSIAMGMTVLTADTVVDDAGEVGWFIDIRPGSLRWAIFDDQAFEFTPISLDIIVPVTQGIPLVVFAYMTLFTWEFTL